MYLSPNIVSALAALAVVVCLMTYPLAVVLVAAVYAIWHWKEQR